MTTAFIPFTMCATVRDENRSTFRTDLERLTSTHRSWAPLDVVRSTDTRALLRGAIPQGVHTATDAGFARYLRDRLLVGEDLHLDFTVSIER